MKIQGKIYQNVEIDPIDVLKQLKKELLIDEDGYVTIKDGKYYEVFYDRFNDEELKEINYEKFIKLKSISDLIHILENEK